jgi:hypothetical protein
MLLDDMLSRGRRRWNGRRHCGADHRASWRVGHAEVVCQRQIARYKGSKEGIKGKVAALDPDRMELLCRVRRNQIAGDARRADVVQDRICGSDVDGQR